jgi:sulfur carrier protein
MIVFVNGQERNFESPCTVRELLEQSRLGKAACAVEVNANLVPRARHGEHVLADGDRVEIVTLVGGG